MRTNAAWNFLMSSLGDDVYAIEALRYFTATTRSLRERERRKIAAFVSELLPHLDREMAFRLVSELGYPGHFEYFDGEHSRYLALLRKIPAERLVRAKDYALTIARGSGRKPIDPFWVERIESEFSPDPAVLSHRRNDPDECA